MPDGLFNNEVVGLMNYLNYFFMREYITDMIAQIINDHMPIVI